MDLAAGEDLHLIAALSHELSGAVTWTIDLGSQPDVQNMACVDSNGMVSNLNTSGAAFDAVVTASCGSASARCLVHCLPAQRSGVVASNVETLNVRFGPGTSYDVLDKLPAGTPLVILEDANGWLAVRYRSAAGVPSVGYVAADYVTITP